MIHPLDLNEWACERPKINVNRTILITLILTITRLYCPTEVSTWDRTQENHMIQHICMKRLLLTQENHVSMQKPKPSIVAPNKVPNLLNFNSQSLITKQ